MRATVISAVVNGYGRMRAHIVTLREIVVYVKGQIVTS